MKLNHQIDQLNTSLLENFSQIAKSDIGCAALVLDLTYLLRKLKVENITHVDALLITDDIGKTLTHIILRESQ